MNLKRTESTNAFRFLFSDFKSRNIIFTVWFVELFVIYLVGKGLIAHFARQIGNRGSVVLGFAGLARSVQPGRSNGMVILDRCPDTPTPITALVVRDR